MPKAVHRSTVAALCARRTPRHRQRLAAEPADVLANRDSGNARSSRLASRDCLAPKERENRFDDIRQFKLRKDTVTVKVARCRVLLDTVPPGIIGTDCSEQNTSGAQAKPRVHVDSLAQTQARLTIDSAQRRAVMPHYAAKGELLREVRTARREPATLART
ncbi:hypothetical protein [Burkholderia multivorans]|uniref:hypothetical protein n=1 Tax=Burkholderia multivorans TaxID=87883 RepID=UPI001C612286|nr:hypothetical protein [Burkholderia multivorans]MDN8000011.1 hypothetical protein [Burkholderia multivorans]